MADSWTCPYCSKFCTIDHNDIYELFNDTQHIEQLKHNISSKILIVICPNSDCRKYSLDLTLSKNVYDNTRGPASKIKLHQWNLLPESLAKTFPEYIPQQIINDYNEACLIQFKSPKASATLSRRCLQGIIRDFWKIKEKNLFEEINAIKDNVSIEVWEAIDAVRHIGNIGAHMEKDVDLIIDVEPEEAGLLIELIETLLHDWYIQRHERAVRFKKLKEVAQDKKGKKNPANTQQTNTENQDTTA